MIKKALIVYDDPFVEIKSGTQNRINNILERLKTLNISVDQLIRCKNKPNLNTTGSLIDKIIPIKRSKMPILKRIIKMIKLLTKKQETRRERKFLRAVGIKTYKLEFLAENLKNQIDVNKYDYVISVNSDNAFWIDAFGKATKKVLLMDDVMFNQFKDRNPKKFVDKYINDYRNYEAKIVNKFDYVIGISQDEINYFKSENNKDKFIYLPAFMKSKNIKNDKNYKYDMIYVACNNLHNVIACKWFLHNVYPHLTNKKILFVGRICDAISDKNIYDNIEFIEYVKNLDDVYNNSKISICPMFSGTGLKIKVVEALAYGKPVVCNKMGAIGQPDPQNFPGFVTDDPKEFTQYIKDLLQDSGLYSKVSNNSLQYFNEYFSYENNVKKLDQVFNA